MAERNRPGDAGDPADDEVLTTPSTTRSPTTMPRPPR
jgi:hypothetical protein